MGFLDKLQQTAKETLEKGKGKVEEVQADRKADQLLRDLGTWYYAGRTGRDEGASSANIERLVGELEAHEAEHGPLGTTPGAEPEAPAAPAPAAAGEPAPAPPPAPAAPATPPPMPDAPVTSGPPPPPPA